MTLALGNVIRINYSLRTSKVSSNLRTVFELLLTMLMQSHAIILFLCRFKSSNLIPNMMTSYVNLCSVIQFYAFMLDNDKNLYI